MKKTHIDYPINDDTLYRLADLFKVFGDPTRIRILYVLSVEELCVQAVSYTHLDVYKRQMYSFLYSQKYFYIALLLALTNYHI